MHDVWRDLGTDSWFAVRLLALTLLTAALAAAYGAGVRWLPVWSIVRAGVQLAVIALLLRGVLAVPWTVVAFVALMLTTASFTSAGRTRELWHGRTAAVSGVLAGALVGLGLVLTLRLVDIDARYVVATGGILIGNAMSASTLAGRNFLRSARVRVAEIEAWLALGATPPAAHREIAREAVRESLLPTLDQAKSTGLVTLPGAFVGALFGGAGPVEAAKFQLVVLAGIALAMTVTAMVVVTVAGRTPYVADVRTEG